jgi:hypothetical protein
MMERLGLLPPLLMQLGILISVVMPRPPIFALQQLNNWHRSKLLTFNLQRVAPKLARFRRSSPYQ